ncbi:MAG: metallopeptidase family protein [Kiloniellales bacterium]|jgi:predicted Zn-dependent protease with MMP-like domain
MMAHVHDIERYSTPPTVADLEAVAREAYAGVPVELRRFVQNVIIRVQDFPDDETLEDLECESPFDLLGLYRGVDLTQKSVVDTPEDVDMIFLYRRPILDYWCEAGEDLTHVVRHIMIHEIGHHFGLSDDDMERIEAEA